MTISRCRILFAKTEAMRYIGHLDLNRAWERLARRARLPLAYTAGYHPHPRIQIGAALPLGVTGENELIDLWLEEERPAEETARALAAHAPPGLALCRLTLPAPDARGLEELIVAGEYAAQAVDSPWPADLPARIAALLASPALPRERRGKAYDLRPRILDIALEGDTLRMRLRLEAEATGRPDEALAALGLDEISATVTRACLLLKTASGELRGSGEAEPA
jgi:radical SAM-linked protein